MTQPPTVPGQQPNQYWPPAPTVPPPAKKSRLPWLLGAGALGLVLVVVLGIALALGQGGSPSSRTPTAWDKEQAQAATETDPTTEAPAPAATPKVADFKLTARITDKKCFGSAGCNIDFKIEMDYLGESLSEDDTWEVTYEVTGVEDGPMIGTLEMTGTTFESYEESVSTTSSKKKIVIKVTSVDKIGI